MHRLQPVESVATIDRHPLHPTVVPLPIGAFVGAFAADVAYARTQDPFWERAGRQLIDAGIVTGLAAGALGAMDFTGRERIRRHGSAWVHGAGNAAVLGLALANRRMRNGGGRWSTTGLAISALSVGILGLTGWLGGELSYRHGIGVIDGDH